MIERSCDLPTYLLVYWGSIILIPFLIGLLFPRDLCLNKSY